MIFLAFILAILLVGLFLYFQIRTKGLTLRAGNFLISLQYSPEEVKKEVVEENAPIVEENTTLNETLLVHQETNESVILLNASQ